MLFLCAQCPQQHVSGEKRYQNNEHSVDARSPAGKGANIISLAESRLIVTGHLLCIYCEPSL